jgi:hypothetical protein
MDGKIVKLWYEYLLRSQNYRDYCRAMRTIKPASGKKNKRIPIIFKKIPYDTYHTWGDIFSVPYEDAYSRFIRSGPAWRGQPILELSQWFKTNAIDLLKSNRRKSGRNITIAEFIKDFDETFRGGGLYLKIDVTRFSTAEILKALKVSIEKKKNEKRIKKLSFIEKQNFATTSKSLRIKDLEQYLRVYDLWVIKTKMKDIVRMIGTRADKVALGNVKCEDVIRKYRDYLAKAKKIIKNVESGFFPGDYSEKYGLEVSNFPIIQ